jgi:C4-dicarboxylate-binding protein DctP
MTALRFAGYQPARSVHTRALHCLRDGLTALANGAMAIQVTDNVVAAGHKASDLLGMVESGQLDGCYFASSYLAARVPELGIFDRPFEAGSREEVFAALDGALGARLAERVVATTGFRVLGWFDNGIRHISNRVRPIRSPADCVGLRLRTLDNAQHQAAFRCLGFLPEFIDVADLPRAVAERRVDAQENPLTNMVNFGLYAHHGFVSLTGHLLGIAPLLVNRARYGALPSEHRAMLDAAARQSEAAQRGLATNEDAECLTLLAKQGVEVATADAIDLQAFRAAVMAS